jgi:hypothetical protein
MTDESLQRLLQSALQRADPATVPADAWSRIAAGVSARQRWSLSDTVLVAVIVTVPLLFPESLVLLALHL